MPSLPAGAAFTHTYPVAHTARRLGTTYLLWCADDTNVVLEGSEINNCGTSLTAVMAEAPDLVERLEIGLQGTIVLRGSYLVKDTVHNQGTGGAGPSMTNYYLSTDAQRGSGDLALYVCRDYSCYPGEVGRGRAIPGLTPGAMNTGSVLVFVPTTIQATDHGTAGRGQKAAFTPPPPLERLLSHESVMSI